MRRRTSTAIGLASCLAFAWPAPAPAPAQIFATPTPTAAPTPPPTPPPPVEPAGQAAAQSFMSGADATRRSWVRASGLRAPLRLLWRADIQAAGPVVTGAGRVYVPDSDGVVALDLRSGRQLWRSRSLTGGLGYADGVLVGVTGSGAFELVAVDARDGSRLWQADTPVEVVAEPLLTAGVAIAQTFDGVFARDLRSGALLWQADSEGEGVPAASGDRVFVSDKCRVAALDLRSGRTLWSHPTACDPNRAGTVLAAGSRVFTETTVLRASDGAAVDAPGVYLAAGNVGVARTAGGTAGFDLGSHRRLWSRPFAAAFVPQLAVGDQLFGGSAEGAIGALNPLRGRLGWAATLRERRGSGTVVDGFAAADGVLVVTQVDRVHALTNAPRAGRRIPMQEIDRFSEAGALLRLAGRPRGPVLPSVQVAVDPFPFGRFDLVGERQFVDASSGYELQSRITRNTRVRVVSPGSRDRSRTITVFAEPRVRYRIRNSGNFVTSRISLRTDRRIRVRGRTAVLYVVRPRQRRATRLGATTVTGPSRNRGTATVRFPALTGLGERDYLYTCVPGLHRMGQGSPNAVQRRCGAASVGY